MRTDQHHPTTRSTSFRGEMEQSMSDLWVIFEIPDKEVSERDYGHDDDDDFISMLSCSQSDFSLSSMILWTDATSSSCSHPHQNNKRHLKSTCKRVDIESPLHRSHFCDKDFSYMFDDSDEDLLSECSYSVQAAESYATQTTTSSSTICYYTGDRWSSLSPTATIKRDQAPHTPQRGTVWADQISMAALPQLDGADQIPRIPCRTGSKLMDKSPQLPRRMATLSSSSLLGQGQ